MKKRDEARYAVYDQRWQQSPAMAQMILNLLRAKTHLSHCRQDQRGATSERFAVVETLPPGHRKFPAKDGQVDEPVYRANPLLILDRATTTGSKLADEDIKWHDFQEDRGSDDGYADWPDTNMTLFQPQRPGNGSWVLERRGWRVRPPPSSLQHYLRPPGLMHPSNQQPSVSPVRGIDPTRDPLRPQPVVRPPNRELPSGRRIPTAEEINQRYPPSDPIYDHSDEESIADWLRREGAAYDEDPQGESTPRNQSNQWQDWSARPSSWQAGTEPSWQSPSSWWSQQPRNPDSWMWVDGRWQHGEVW